MYFPSDITIYSLDAIICLTYLLVNDTLIFPCFPLFLAHQNLLISLFKVLLYHIKLPIN